MAKHGNNKTKKTGRKYTRTIRSEKADDVLIAPAESSVKNDRIKSAIENGSQSILPSDTTKGHYLAKFEHKGKEGPLVVYAEDRKIFNSFGHFTVITSFKPSDSLRNQLFFASATTSSNSAHTSSTSCQIPPQTTKGYGDRSHLNDIQETASFVRQKNNGDGARQKQRQPNSFEGLVTHYKKRQEKYSRLLGDDSLYLFKKIEHICQAKIKENNAKKSAKPQKERKQDSHVLPVLPNITVDKTSDEPLNGKSKHDHFSKQKRESKLPYLTVSRYSKLQ